MARKANFLKSRTRSTFTTSLFIIALVLFFMSLFAGAAIYSNMLLEEAQENFELMVTLPDHTPKARRDSLGRHLTAQPFVKEIRYISKQEAGQEFIAELGDEFMEIMDGVNPLPASFNIKLNHDWINSDSLTAVNAAIMGQDILPPQDISYPMGEIEQLRANIVQFIRIAAGIGLIVTLIAFFIVNSTIRLAIYGKRLMIRSMQLIGATGGFIRRPFVRLGVLQGFLGALIANAILLGLMYGLHQLGVDSLETLLFREEFLFLLGGIVIFGTILGWLSSTWAVSRFLHKSMDQLM
ncbi:MAG: permease-like cell division protein FtsX [Bacteroidota bacterium]